MEDEAAKSLLQLELNNAGLKEFLSMLFINSAELVEYEQQDGSHSKCLLVKIPYRSLSSYRKVSEKVISHLEQKFNWPVVVVATRTILSKHCKKQGPQHVLTLFPNSQEGKHPDETQKQNSHRRARSNPRRYCIIYYNRHSLILINIVPPCYYYWQIN